MDISINPWVIVFLGTVFMILFLSSKPAQKDKLINLISKYLSREKNDQQ